MKTNYLKCCLQFIALAIYFLTLNACKKSNQNNLSITVDNTVKDIDGNIYHTIKIGNQTWMLENLKVTRYNNGDSIPYIAASTDWAVADRDAYCFQIFNSISYKDTLGCFYTFKSITDARNICPKGWHVPSDAEWTELENNVGGREIAGLRLREPCALHWTTDASQKDTFIRSGFNCRGAGYRENDGFLYDYRNEAWFWTSTNIDSLQAMTRDFWWSENAVSHNITQVKGRGLSVRCIKD